MEAERDVLLAAQQVAAPATAAMLLDIKGIGPEFAAILWSEGLFRHFDNRRQVASYAGLAPTPWQSGSVDREQGVSKAGNPRLRTTLIQLAWLWLRHQPQSALALWFEERVRRNGGRLKKTTIVALARKLLVALWKYVTAGGAQEDETILEDGLFRPCSDAVRPPGSARTDQVLEDLRIRSAFIVRYVVAQVVHFRLSPDSGHIVPRFRTYRCIALTSAVRPEQVSAPSGSGILWLRQSDSSARCLPSDNLDGNAR